MDWLAEEKLLWSEEMARSKRDFEQALRAGLIPILPDRSKAQIESNLMRSKWLIAASESLLEVCAERHKASAALRTSCCTPSVLRSLRASGSGD